MQIYATLVKNECTVAIKGKENKSKGIKDELFTKKYKLIEYLFCTRLDDFVRCVWENRKQKFIR